MRGEDANRVWVHTRATVGQPTAKYTRLRGEKAGWRLALGRLRDLTGIAGSVGAPIGLTR